MNLAAVTVWVGTVSAILASLLTLDVSLPIKFLLAGFAGTLYLIFYQLRRLEDQLGKLLHFIRCDYIANEIKRLNPEDRRPAKDILASDLKEEKGMEQVERQLFLSGLIISNLAWIVILVAAVAIATALFYKVLR